MQGIGANRTKGPNPLSQPHSFKGTLGEVCPLLLAHNLAKAKKPKQGRLRKRFLRRARPHLQTHVGLWVGQSHALPIEKSVHF